MCGLAGILSIEDTICDSVLEKMANSLEHRGPDSSGTWHDKSQGVGFAHRRLSILDLSDAGHQPMLSSSGRYVLIFNGEIYNHQEIRAELDEHDSTFLWRGHSDTETLLASIETWGILEAVKRLIGMFAIALWDRETKELTLVRDRLGEKPLYYGWLGGTFLFGSELKAMKAHESFVTDIDRDSLALYMRHGYITAPHSIYKGVKKLLPGSMLKVSLRQKEPYITKYWDLLSIAGEARVSPFCGSSSDAISGLDVMLKNAIAQQMKTDVPFGAFLSGGIDSSAVVALMQAQSDRAVKTFSIGFHEENYNEAEHAKAVATHIGTDHTELYLTQGDCLNLVPRMGSVFDEPFADSSQIPTFLVSQLAREHVTVSLSGDAGDELFAGYNQYTVGSSLWNKISKVPLSIRQALALGINSLPASTWSNLAKPLQTGFPHQLSEINIGDKLHKLAGVLRANSVRELHHQMVSGWLDPASVVINSIESRTAFTSADLDLRVFSSTEQMMLLDLLTFLPDDILCKVDRAAMATSLETRVPFLDHRVVEFALQLPMEYKVRDNQSKWVLRQLLYQYVPKRLIERPKMGFGVPIDNWLRGELREWAENLLSVERLEKDGYFDPSLIRQKWAEHLTGERNWQQQLWNVLMFNVWLDNQN